MKRLGPWVMLLVVSLPLCAGCKSGSSKTDGEYRTTTDPPRRNTELARKLYDQAVEELEEDKLDKAEAKLKEALNADVTFGPGHNALGKVYYQQGKLYQAAWEFQYAAKLMPDQPEPKNNLGLVLEAAGKLDEAQGYLEDAVNRAPDNPQYIGNLARVRVRRGLNDETTRELLQDLIYKDSRPEWVAWAKERLVLLERQEAPEPHQEPDQTQAPIDHDSAP